MSQGQADVPLVLPPLPQVPGGGVPLVLSGGGGGQVVAAAADVTAGGGVSCPPSLRVLGRHETPWLGRELLFGRQSSAKSITRDFRTYKFTFSQLHASSAANPEGGKCMNL